MGGLATRLAPPFSLVNHAVQRRAASVRALLVLATRPMAPSVANAGGCSSEAKAVAGTPSVVLLQGTNSGRQAGPRPWFAITYGANVNPGRRAARSSSSGAGARWAIVRALACGERERPRRAQGGVPAVRAVSCPPQRRRRAMAARAFAAPCSRLGDAVGEGVGGQSGQARGATSTRCSCLRLAPPAACTATPWAMVLM
jgi:hypothetical protein